MKGYHNTRLSRRSVKKT